MNRLVSFLAELRRRRVYQVAALYAAAAFVAAQAADLFLPRLGLPDWTVTAVVVLAVVGFPVVLILAWVFDVTPSGVRRALPASETAAAPPEAPGKWRVAGGTTAAVVVLIGGGWWLSSLALGPTPAIQSLAVLPFENLTGDPGQEYFVDGMHDALIAELSQIGALHVISRTSVRRYRGTDEPLEGIGRELGVGGLIEAAVTRDSDRVRVSVRLVHAPSERQLWARTFERDVGGVLAMHGEISRAIAREVRIALAPGEETEIHSVDPDAYDAYLRGRFHWHQLGAEEWERSIAYFQEAIARDPDWALPWAGLSDTYHRLGDSRIQPGHVAYPLARTAALAALERDPDAAEAHLSLGAVKYHWEWDWDGADASFRRAVSLNPSNSYAPRWYSLFLRAMGRHDEAIEHAEKAFLVDPLHPLAQTGVPLTLSIAGRNEEAAQRLERLLEREPGHPVARRELGKVYLASGDVARAIPLLEEAAALRRRAHDDLYLAVVYARAGRAEEARAIMEQVSREHGPEGVRSVDLAAAHLALGEVDRTLEVLEAGIHDRDGSIPEMATSRRLRPLHSEPRFQALLERVGLDAAARASPPVQG